MPVIPRLEESLLIIIISKAFIKIGKGSPNFLAAKRLVALRVEYSCVES